jgi:hypothetical protein
MRTDEAHYIFLLRSNLMLATLHGGPAGFQRHLFGTL